MSKQAIWAKSITAAVLMALIVGYAGYNLAAQQPYYRFAVDSGWDVRSRAARLDQVVNGQAVGQEWMLDRHASMLALLGKQVSNGFQVMRGAEGTLHYTNFFPYETYDYRYYAGRMGQLDEMVRQQGGSFLFLAATNKGPRDDGQQELFSAADFSARADALIYGLQGLDIPWLDSRQFLKQAGLNDGMYRYRTDPRWTVEACFEVFAGTVEALEESGWRSLDPQGFYTDPQNYTRTAYPGSFTGDFALQAGIPFAGQDDFTLYIPAFPTDFSVTTSHYDNSVTVRGSFEETVLRSRYLTAENPYERSLFHSYFGGPAPLRVIENHRNEAGPKILLIGDDYSAPLAAFLAPLAGELHYIWSYENPEVKDLPAYLKAHGFDLVIWELSPANITPSGLGILLQQ